MYFCVFRHFCRKLAKVAKYTFFWHNSFASKIAVADFFRQLSGLSERTIYRERDCIFLTTLLSDKIVLIQKLDYIFRELLAPLCPGRGHAHTV